MVESCTVKYAIFLSELFIFILKPFELSGIFYANKNRTIEYFKLLVRCISLKLIL